MKKRYRDSALNGLFARLQSDDFDRREHALFQIALMLHRENRDQATQSMPDLGSENLPRELLRLRLSPVVQGLIVDSLSLLIAKRRESRASAFWTLSEVAAEIGWEPTLALLKSCAAMLDEEAAFQACHALRRWLETGALTTEQVSISVDAFDLVDILGVWTESSDERLRRAASMVMGRVSELR